MDQQLILYALIGFVAGAFIVWLIGRGARSDADATQDKLQALQKEFETYRENVNAHFAKTADAVDNLTKSYQDVFTHLSDGAQKLMDKNALKAQLEKRQGKAVTLAYLVNEQQQSASHEPTPVAKDSVVLDQAPAKAGNGKSSKTLHYPAQANSEVVPAQKSKDGKHITLSYPSKGQAAPLVAADKASPQAAADKTGEKADTNSEKDAAAKAETVKKRNVEIAAEKAGLNLRHKDTANPGETSLESVKRHLREQGGDKK